VSLTTGRHRQNRGVAPGTEILTVGHSNHEERAFLDLLRGAGVELIADVRANPRSRYPQFNRSALAGALGAEGIRYSHLGTELGGRRKPAPGSPNVGWGTEPFRGYADQMASEEFQAGLARLEDLAREQRTAVMCAEADWTRCHRRLLADALTVLGGRVLHLGPTGSFTPHVLTDFAVVENDRITYPARQTSLGL
jgi:uncharacterized protein (DUF488 family)